MNQKLKWLAASLVVLGTLGGLAPWTVSGAAMRNELALQIRETTGLVAEAREPTRSHEGPEAVLGRMASLIQRLAADAGDRPAAVGIGVPGLVDVAAGTTLFLPNMPGQWRGVEVRATLERLLGVPVAVVVTEGVAVRGPVAVVVRDDVTVRVTVAVAVGKAVGVEDGCVFVAVVEAVGLGVEVRGAVVLGEAVTEAVTVLVLVAVRVGVTVQDAVVVGESVAAAVPVTDAVTVGVPVGVKADDAVCVGVGNPVVVGEYERVDEEEDVGRCVPLGKAERVAVAVAVPVPVPVPVEDPVAVDVAVVE
jgi:hypothetical protein